MALQTAAISIPDLVPSMNELNIFGFAPDLATVSGLQPKWSQTVSGVDAWKLGWYRVPFPAQVTGKPQARAQSTSSQMMAGWSPYAKE